MVIAFSAEQLVQYVGLVWEREVRGWRQARESLTEPQMSSMSLAEKRV
jgi:hypothetical protein